MILQIITISAVVAVANTACICHEDVPFWEAPCWSKITNLKFDENEVKPTETIKRSMTMKSLKELKVILNISLFFYQEENITASYKNLYSAELTGLKWLPGRSRINMDIHNIGEIPSAIQSLYSDLQTFGIVFHQMLKEEIDDVTKNFVDRTIINLRSLLCEVQSALVWLQIPIPANIEVGKLPQEYKTSTKTEQTVRNFLLIKKYGEYLRQRLKFIKTTRRRFRRRRQSGGKKRTSSMLSRIG